MGRAGFGRRVRAMRMGGVPACPLSDGPRLRGLSGGM